MGKQKKADNGNQAVNIGTKDLSYFKEFSFRDENQTDGFSELGNHFFKFGSDRFNVMNGSQFDFCKNLQKTLKLTERFML